MPKSPFVFLPATLIVTEEELEEGVIEVGRGVTGVDGQGLAIGVDGALPILLLIQADAEIMMGFQVVWVDG